MTGRFPDDYKIVRFPEASKPAAADVRRRKLLQLQENRQRKNSPKTPLNRRRNIQHPTLNPSLNRNPPRRLTLKVGC